MPQAVVKDEIERRMKLLKLNPASLSQKAGLNRWYVRDLLEGKTRDPSAKSLAKLAFALGCSVADLMTKGVDFIFEGEDGSVMVAEAKTYPRDNRSERGTLRIEELELVAHAGAGALHDIEEVRSVWQLPRDLVRSYSSTPAEDIKIATVIGDSMEPTLMASTKVMIDTRDVRPSPPGVFFVWDGIGLVAKRVEIIPGSEPIRVRLISDNPRYTPYEVTLEDAHIQGRVMGLWKWM